jgi:hypothetical protein
MITLKEYMELSKYRVTEGSEYYGYGPNNFCLSYWNGKYDGFNLTIIFNVDSQEVIAVEACDYSTNKACRRINPVYKKKYKFDKFAWDEVAWEDLSNDDEWMQYAVSISKFETASQLETKC